MRGERGLHRDAVRALRAQAATLGLAPPVAAFVDSKLDEIAAALGEVASSSAAGPVH